MKYRTKRVQASMNRLLIIGNGFDLAHSFKTKYEDFIDWYLNQENDSSGILHKELIDNSGHRVPR